MAYLPTDEEKQAELDRQRLVYDQAITGAQEIRIVDPVQGEVLYTNPNLPAIVRRIAELEAQLSGCPTRHRIVVGG